MINGRGLNFFFQFTKTSEDSQFQRIKAQVFHVEMEGTRIWHSSRAADPHSFHADPEPVCSNKTKSGSGSRFCDLEWRTPRKKKISILIQTVCLRMTHSRIKKNKLSILWLSFYIQSREKAWAEITAYPFPYYRKGGVWRRNKGGTRMSGRGLRWE